MNWTLFMAIASIRDRDEWLIAIAASAGGIPAIVTVLNQLPRDLPASIVIVQHRAPTKESILDVLLARQTGRETRIAINAHRIEPGIVYVARPDLHLTVGANRRFAYVDGTRLRGLLSSANPLFESAATVFGPRMIAIVLTGSGTDATDGVQTVKAHGGVVIVQDPSTAAHFGMPTSAIGSGAADYVLALDAIADRVASIVRGHEAADASRIG